MLKSSMRVDLKQKMTSLNINADDAKFLKELADTMNSQNNRSTDSPIFCIYDKREIQSENGDIRKWIEHETGDYIEVEDTDEAVEEYLQKESEENVNEEIRDAIKILFGTSNIDVEEYEGLTFADNEEAMEHLGFVLNTFEEVDVFQGIVFLTEKEAENYIKARHYNYNKPYVYAHSSYHSDEMKRLLSIISKLGDNPASSTYYFRQ